MVPLIIPLWIYTQHELFTTITVMNQELGTPETHIIRLRMLTTKQKAFYATQANFKRVALFINSNIAAEGFRAVAFQKRYLCLTLRPTFITTMDRETAERIVRDGRDIYTSYTRDGAAYEDVCTARGTLEGMGLRQYANGSWDY